MWAHQLCFLMIYKQPNRFSHSIWKFQAIFHCASFHLLSQILITKNVSFCKTILAKSLFATIWFVWWVIVWIQIFITACQTFNLKNKWTKKLNGASRKSACSTILIGPNRSSMKHDDAFKTWLNNHDCL